SCEEHPRAALKSAWCRNTDRFGGLTICSGMVPLFNFTMEVTTMTHELLPLLGALRLLFAARKPRGRRSSSLTKLLAEPLEERCLLASLLWVRPDTNFAFWNIADNWRD